MTYRANLWKLILASTDHLIRINKAERITRLFLLFFSLILLTVFLYGWMAWLGIGTDILSPTAVSIPREAYEADKLSFLIGRVLYALLFSLFILLFPSLVFKTFFRIKFSKVILLQLAILMIFLIERLIWIPLYLYFGWDWYASPFSAGPLLAFFTGSPFWIYLGGTVSLFLLWMIGLQISYLSIMTKAKKVWIWVTVVTLHILYLAGAASVSYYATDILTFFLRGQ